MMELNEQAPPAKHPKLDAHSSGNEPGGDCIKSTKSSYASEVSRRLYSDKDTVNVFFTFEDSDERVSAHRYVLANASKVFRTLLYGPMAPNGDILLRETPTEAFKIVIQFCYLDEVNLKLDHITEVIKLLDHYGMVECLESCGRFWADNWCVDDICSAYSWAINLHMTEFQGFCERKIGVNSDAVFKTDGFLSCSFDVLDRIMSLDSLLSAESTILGACLNWARKQCELNGDDPNDTANLRAYFKDQHYKIRYGSMTVEELSTHVDECNGLFADVGEYEDVMRLLSGKTNLKTGKFQTEPRSQLPSSVWYEKKMVAYDLLTQSHPANRTFNGQVATTVLSTNQPILLTGVQTVRMHCKNMVVFHPMGGPNAPIPVELKINEIYTKPITNNTATKLIYRERNVIKRNVSHDLYFSLQPRPIILKPNHEYHFKFALLSANCSADYEVLEIKREVQLDKDVCIRIRADQFVIKTCKFTPL